MDKRKLEDLSETFKGFPTCVNISPAYLRTWNQRTIRENILRDCGELIAREFVLQLPAVHQKQLVLLETYIELKGFDVVHREIHRKFN